MKGLLCFTLIAGICGGSARAADRTTPPFETAPPPLVLDLAPLEDPAEIARFDRDGDGWLAPGDLGAHPSASRDTAFRWARRDALEAMVQRRMGAVFARWPDLDREPFVVWLALSGWALDDVGPPIDSLVPVLLQPWMDEVDAAATAAGWFSLWALQVADRKAQRVGRLSLLRWNEVELGDRMLELLSEGELRFGIDPTLKERNFAMAYRPASDTIVVPPGWETGATANPASGRSPQLSLLHELRHALQDLGGKPLRLTLGEVDAHIFDRTVGRMAYGAPVEAAPVVPLSKSPPSMDDPDAVSAWIVRKALGGYGGGFFEALREELDAGVAHLRPEHWLLEARYAELRMRDTLFQDLRYHLDLRRQAGLGLTDADVAAGYAQADEELPRRVRLTRDQRAELYGTNLSEPRRVRRQLNSTAVRTSRAAVEGGPEAAARWLRREFNRSEQKALLRLFLTIEMPGDGIGGWVLDEP